MVLVGLVQPGAFSAAAKKTTLRVALGGFENNLTPFTVTFASQPNTHDLLNLVYDTLFWSQAQAQPEPWLALRAEPSADRKEWTVTLRKDIKWHDGRAFTADDVKFTFDYFQRFAGLSGRYGHHVAGIPSYDHARVIDSRTVRLSFKDAAPSFRILPGADLPILPKHVWEKIDDPLAASTGNPVGTGPYVVKEITPNTGYRLVANSDYFKGKPLVDELDLAVMPGPDAAFQALRESKVDFVTTTPGPALVDQLTADNALKVVKGTRMESVQLNFNTRKPPLNDPQLRKAISLAIDNQVLVTSVLGGRGAGGVDEFLHPLSPWAAAGGKHELDVEKAKTLLGAAGYGRKDADEVRRSADGKRLEFEVLFSNLEPQSLRSLQLISTMTTAIGVLIHPKAVSPEDLRKARRNSTGKPGDFDAYISSLDVHTHTDPDALSYLFHTPGPKGIGAQTTGYSNPVFDAIAEKASVTDDVAARKQLVAQLQTILAKDVPAMVLYYPDGIYAFRPAAYERWIPDPGQGIFTKRSFLKAYAQPLPEAESGRRIPAEYLFLGGVAALVALATGAALLVKARPKRAPKKSADVEEYEGSREVWGAPGGGGESDSLVDPGQEANPEPAEDPLGPTDAESEPPPEDAEQDLVPEYEPQPVQEELVLDPAPERFAPEPALEEFDTGPAPEEDYPVLDELDPTMWEESEEEIVEIPPEGNPASLPRAEPSDDPAPGLN